MPSALLAGKRGWKECQDIIEAAVEQGWEARPKGQHLWLVPPDKDGKPVSLSGTPSDHRSRINFLTAMRRSGAFTWPWAPNKPKAQDNGLVNVDIINAALAQGWTMDTSKAQPWLISPSSVQICLPRSETDYVRFNFLQNMRRHGLQWPPKTAVPDANPTPVEQAPHNQEESVVMTIEEPTQEAAKEPTWVKIMDPQWMDGYWISDEGELRRPDGSIDKGKGGYAKQPNIILGIQRSNGRRTTTRMDRLVLTAFKGESDTLPVHLDGNPLNCALVNLEWGEEKFKGGQIYGPRKPKVEDDVLGIEDLELVKRTTDLLTYNGVKTTGDLQKLSTSDLETMGFAPAELADISAKMELLGLSLAPNPVAEVAYVEETAQELAPEFQEAATAIEDAQKDEPKMNLDWGSPDEQKPARRPRKAKRAAKKAPAKRPAPAPAPVLPVGVDDVIVTKTYRLRDVAIEVGPDGFVEVPETDDMEAVGFLFLAIARDR